MGLPKRSRVVGGNRPSWLWKLITLGPKEVMVKLVKLRKRPKIVRHKIFKKAEDVMKFIGINGESCGTT